MTERCLSSAPVLDARIPTPQHSEKRLLKRSDFIDAPHWKKLASKFKVRLPSWKMAPSPHWMELYLKRLGLPHSDYKDWSGFGSFREFIEANPGWPLTAFVGLMLEVKERKP